jgi:hypothetical protein
LKAANGDAFDADIAAVQRIGAVPRVLEVAFG